MTQTKVKSRLIQLVNYGGIPWMCRNCYIQSPGNPSRNMERIALDLRKYDSPEKLRSSIIFDTASLAIEASSSENPRVNPHFYVKRGEDWVITPGADKRDVSQQFTEETSLDQVATIAGREIRKIAISEKVGSTFVWISPKSPYPESRIVVGVKKETKSKRFEYLKCYGISTTLSREECLNLGQFLISLSSNKYEYPEDPENLRPVVIKVDVPEGEDAFNYLSKIIELPEKDRFQSILDGSADKNKAKAVKAAVIATEVVRLNPNVIYSNPIVYGAYVETMMKHEGFEMDPSKFGCGKSNVEMFSNTTASFEYSSTTSAIPENTKNCPTCGMQLICGYCKMCKQIKVKIRS